MTREIPLTQGKVALVDDEDYERVQQYRWHMTLGSRYVTTTYIINKERTTLLLHRFILAAPDGMQVDHINHDTLDNRRSNIRLVTTAENQHNQRPKPGRFLGVRRRQDTGRWRAEIRVNKKKISLGCFASATEAAHVYDEASHKLFGPFASSNFGPPEP